MKTSSAKAKGRRGATETADLLKKYAPDLKEGDIRVASSGSNGEDVLLSPAAQAVYPLAIECKNTEQIQIWKAYEQACSHAIGKEGIYPIVFFKKNLSKLMVCLSAEHFMKLTR